MPAFTPGNLSASLLDQKIKSYRPNAAVGRLLNLLLGRLRGIPLRAESGLPSCCTVIKMKLQASEEAGEEGVSVTKFQKLFVLAWSPAAGPQCMGVSFVHIILGPKGLGLFAWTFHGRSLFRVW